ncbi:MAG TPA: VOC family protein [Casimicrobiaceae bacterium]|nr:VOC family protein [Casimicrobiaceae bacterium]
MSDFNAQYNRVVWFDLPVVDLDRAGAFYQAVLGVKVHKEKFGDVAFCVVEHEQGNGGCLVVDPAKVSSGGPLMYLNVEGRIRDAVAGVTRLGGKVLQDVHPIGPHGFRAVVQDSEGNRVALHSSRDA